MESVNYEYFDSENDYSKNPNATKHRSFNVSRGDFSKYAILNGFYGKKLISRDARKFYSSMCRMAVKKEKGFYVISDEYEFAETSYKNVISFAMGMLATRIIANEIYNINKLYHFTDIPITTNYYVMPKFIIDHLYKFRRKLKRHLSYTAAIHLERL